MNENEIVTLACALIDASLESKKARDLYGQAKAVESAKEIELMEAFAEIDEVPTVPLIVEHPSLGYYIIYFDFDTKEVVSVQPSASIPEWLEMKRSIKTTPKN